MFLVLTYEGGQEAAAQIIQMNPTEMMNAEQGAVEVALGDLEINAESGDYVHAKSPATSGWLSSSISSVVQKVKTTLLYKWPSSIHFSFRNQI